MSDDIATIDVIGAFASEDQEVINWGGNNFFRGCGEVVTENDDGSKTMCVKRLGHPGDIHEDYDGVRKTISFGEILYVAGTKLPASIEEGHQNAQAVMARLKLAFEGSEVTRIRMVVKETSDELIMILEGDG